MAEGNPAGPFNSNAILDPSIDPENLPEVAENASPEERNYRAWLAEAHPKWEEEQAEAQEAETPDARAEREAQAHDEAVAAKEERTGQTHPENVESTSQTTSQAKRGKAKS